MTARLVLRRWRAEDRAPFACGDDATRHAAGSGRRLRASAAAARPPAPAARALPDPPAGRGRRVGLVPATTWCRHRGGFRQRASSRSNTGVRSLCLNASSSSRSVSRIWSTSRPAPRADSTPRTSSMSFSRPARSFVTTRSSALMNGIRVPATSIETARSRNRSSSPGPARTRSRARLDARCSSGTTRVAWMNAAVASMRSEKPCASRVYQAVGGHAALDGHVHVRRQARAPPHQRRLRTEDVPSGADGGEGRREVGQELNRTRR